MKKQTKANPVSIFLTALVIALFAAFVFYGTRISIPIQGAFEPLRHLYHHRPFHEPHQRLYRDVLPGAGRFMAIGAYAVAIFTVPLANRATIFYLEP